MKKKLKKGLTFTDFSDRLFPVSERNKKTKTVKVKGPWVDGVQTVKEISLEEWTSYTPLNTRVKGQWFRVVGW